SRRPGLAPWVWGDVPAAKLQRSQRYPAMPETLTGNGPIPYPSSSYPAKIYSDFARDGAAGNAPLTRVDVNRPLPAYPPADPLTGKITDKVAFARAQQARQILARDILVRLIKACGAYDPA